MKKFKYLHFWLIFPFLITFFGFYFSYWSIFTEVPFYQHVHGLTATLWFLLIVLQPYLYQKNRMKMHRTLGIIGLFLAGGVVFSSLQIVPNNLKINVSDPSQNYIFILIDFVTLIGFSYAVILSILKKREIEIHARFMISTVFWIMLPALTRFLYFSQIPIFGRPTPLTFKDCLYLAGYIILITLLVLILLDYKKHKKIFRAYSSVSIATFFILLTINYFTKAQWWIKFCNTLFGNG